MSQSASLGAAPVPAPPVPVKTKRRRRWPWFALAAVVLLIVMIVVLTSKNSTTTATAAKPKATAAQVAPPPPVASHPQAPATAAGVPDSVYTGSGDDVIKLNRPAGMKIVRLSCPQCSGNTALTTDGAESLLVNTIGPYNGQQWADAADNTTSTLTLKATGSWTITVGGRDMIRATDKAISGTGDDVVLLTGNTSIAAITNQGSANFVVQDVATSGGSPDLAVNTIGAYHGTVPLPGPVLVQITSDGTWTITPQS